MATPTVINLFCSVCNAMQDFDVTIDQYGEYVCVCRVCGHAVKFAADCDLAEAVVAHNTDNTPSTLADGDGNIIPDAEQQQQIAAAVEVAPPVDAQPAPEDAAPVEDAPVDQAPVDPAE